MMVSFLVLQIKFLNKFVKSLMETLESSEFGHSYFPNTIPRVHVMEFAQHYMLTLAPHRYVGGWVLLIKTVGDAERIR